MRQMSQCASVGKLFLKVPRNAHGGGRVVCASGSKTSVSSSTPTSVTIYDAYTSIKKKKKKKKKKKSTTKLYLRIAQLQGVECRTKQLLGSMPSTADLT